MSKTYKIVRHYMRHDEERRVLFTGKSLEWVQDYCCDHETSSKTCLLAHNQHHTMQHGDWFDGYEEE